MSSYAQVIGDTLAQVNVLRRAFGKAELTDLPDARPGDSQDCLYFRALSDCGVTDVGGGSMGFANERQAKFAAEIWGTTANGAHVQSPVGIRNVIRGFDNRELSHYDV